MPTYEYACTACAEHIEVVQSFTDSSLTECPSCAGKLRKVFSPVGVVFKGSGFYKTDSRSSATSASKKSEGKSEGKSESKSEGKSTSSGDASSSGDSTPKAKPADSASTTKATSSPGSGSTAAAS